MSKLILIRGLPGSGKTTKARTKYPDYLHYETDHLFTDCGGRYRFNAQIWQQARDLVFSLADVALSNGENVVVCDLFHRTAEIDPYRELATYHDAQFKVIRAYGARRSVHPVPLTVMRRLTKEAEA